MESAHRDRDRVESPCGDRSIGALPQHLLFTPCLAHRGASFFFGRGHRHDWRIQSVILAHYKVLAQRTVLNTNLPAKHWDPGSSAHISLELPSPPATPAKVVLQQESLKSKYKAFEAPGIVDTQRCRAHCSCCPDLRAQGTQQNDTVRPPEIKLASPTILHSLADARTHNRTSVPVSVNKTYSLRT